MEEESEDLGGDFTGDLTDAVEGRGFAGEVGFVRDPAMGVAFPETCFFTVGNLAGSGGVDAVVVVSADFSVVG